jgi:hypothetical protein
VRNNEQKLPFWKDKKGRGAKGGGRERGEEFMAAVQDSPPSVQTTTSDSMLTALPLNASS